MRTPFLSLDSNLPYNPHCSQQVRAWVTKAKAKCCVKYGWDLLLGGAFVFPRHVGRLGDLSLLIRKHTD